MISSLIPNRVFICSEKFTTSSFSLFRNQSGATTKFSEHLNTFKTSKNSQRTSKIKIIKKIIKSYRNVKFRYTHSYMCLLQTPEWVAADWFRKKMKEEILNFSEHLKTLKTVKNSQRTSKIKIAKKCTKRSSECGKSTFKPVEIGDFTL